MNITIETLKGEKVNIYNKYHRMAGKEIRKITHPEKDKHMTEGSFEMTPLKAFNISGTTVKDSSKC